MTTNIKTALAELADVAPHGVEAMAGTALRTATARRRRRSAVNAAAVTLVAALGLGVALIGVPSAQRDAVPARGSGGSGYPQRIQGPLPSKLPLLPARPGPLAGLIRTGLGDWQGIRPDAQLYQLSGTNGVSLSPNGRYLTYVEPPRTFIVRDLVKGTTSTAQGVTLKRPEVFWSPDSTRFAVPVLPPSSDTNDLSRTVIMDPATQATRIVEVPGSVTGFAANRSTLVTVPTNEVPTSTSGVVRDPAVRVVDISGDVITALRSKAILEKFKYSPDASVSLDGSRLALTESFKGSFAYIDLRTGRIDPGDAVVPVPCRASWHSDSTAAIFAADGTLSYVDGPTRLRTMPTGNRQPRVLTVVDPRIIAHCLHLTRAALAGPAANGEFLGVRTGWWTWRWRELGTWAIGSLVFLLLIVALMRRQLRRRRDRLT